MADVLGLEPVRVEDGFFEPPTVAGIATRLPAEQPTVPVDEDRLKAMLEQLEDL